MRMSFRWMSSLVLLGLAHESPNHLKIESKLTWDLLSIRRFCRLNKMKKLFGERSCLQWTALRFVIPALHFNILKITSSLLAIVTHEVAREYTKREKNYISFFGKYGNNHISTTTLMFGWGIPHQNRILKLKYEHIQRLFVIGNIQYVDTATTST